MCNYIILIDMQEKILAKLKEQRGENSQVSDKTLESMAKTWANVVKDDETLGNIDFTEQISSLQGNIGHIAKQVKDDAEKNYQGFKSPEQLKKEAEEAERLKNKGGGKEISPEVQALIDQNKQIMETLGAMKSEKITTSRTGELETILKDAPKAYKDQILLSFDKMQFESDEDFGSFKETTKTNFSNFQQMAKEQGVVFNSPALNVQKPIDNGQTPELAKASQMVSESKKEK